MKSKLHGLGFALITIIFALSVLFMVGGVTPTASIGPQGPVGPQESVGPDTTDVGPQGRVGPDVTVVRREAGRGLIFGIDWVYVVASGLVLVALGAGLAIGRGPRQQTLRH